MTNHPDIPGQPSALAQSGLATTRFQAESLSIEERVGWRMTRLQQAPGSARPEWPGIELPERVGDCGGSEPTALCLGPREWLLMEKAETPARLAADLPTDENLYWTDLSDALALFRLEGPGAPWLLNKLSCLDFQSCHDAGEHCARTRLGQVTAVIHFHRAPDGTERFDLVTDRSVARYAWELLCASAPHADDLARMQGEAA